MESPYGLVQIVNCLHDKVTVQLENCSDPNWRMKDLTPFQVDATTGRVETSQLIYYRDASDTTKGPYFAQTTNITVYVGQDQQKVYVIEIPQDSIPTGTDKDVQLYLFKDKIIQTNTVTSEVKEYE